MATPQPAHAGAILPFPARPPAPPLLLSPPHLAGGELDRVRETMEAGWLAPAGPTPAAFEDALATTTGMQSVLATASGTAALHLGYRVLGVAPGDEVWAPAMTFVASVAPAVQMGAIPRFLDVVETGWTMDPGLLAEELSKAARRGRLPRVVVPVDLYGQCCDLDAIVAACDRWGVPVMCDSAAAMGATQRGGRHAGRGARLAAYSFNGNKIVTAGGGGALAGDDAALLARARQLAGQAKEAWPHYEHETTGYTYGLSSVLAAVGLAQLSALPARVARRRDVFARYVAGLADLPGTGFIAEPAWGRANRWLTVLLIDPAPFGADREVVRRVLQAAGIESRPAWKPLHLQPAFRDAPQAGGATAAALFERGLCLPSGTGMSDADQARVIDLIRSCARN
ncbi:DegT/DnrJ/EryC1/StrS family aminotransferase [Falsiroseomonas stagni]|uniref:DegT/DnrJ/EryC1/StrS aminotransferase family protein n=1 Tax=Falsiroseomonas stagni DSM 19981 TaxID=1123062 RepID=A0A1I4A7M7_9PROT|nr:DegT/DnrJ/EryC1/StrS family aminotransferase [Falsiroseomonas stagni]SFK52333.1 DegT/DnrJ/EryC1/StrS aminotransferase family protein [Falsiroseomonas stagni DSM 19981]